MNETIKRPEGKVRPVVLKEVNGEMVEVRNFEKADNAVTDSFMCELVSNQGFEYLFRTPNTLLRYMFLGTGTTPYTAETTQMGNKDSGFYGAIDSNVEFNIDFIDNGDGTYHIEFKTAYSFGLGDVVGTFTEFATAQAYSGANAETVMSGGLFRDTAGDPVAITVSADEQLIVYYEFRMAITAEEYADFSTVVGSSSPFFQEAPPSIITVNGSDHTATPSRRFLLVQRYADPGSTNGYVAALSPALTAGYNTSGRIIDSNDDATTVNSSSTSANVDGGGTIAADKKSITYDYVFSIFPSSGITDVKELQFGNYSNASSTVLIEFDPPIPIPAGDRFDFHYNTTLSWS